MPPLVDAGILPAGWKPGYQVLREKREGMYPYVKVFNLQFGETKFPRKFVQVQLPFWTLPSEVSFLKGWLKHDCPVELRANLQQ